MNYWEIFFIGVGLAMDAFAVSICKGMSLKKMSLKGALAAGLYFGGFQALMPLLGWFLGSSFARYVAAAGHWIAFVLLAFVGGGMIREAVRDARAKRETPGNAASAGSLEMPGASSAEAGEDVSAGASAGSPETSNASSASSAEASEDVSAGASAGSPKASGSFGPRSMIPLAIATSIDAFAVGVSLSFYEVNIYTAIAIIGCTTFAISAAGVRIGMLFGEKWSAKAEAAGGCLLILIGIILCVRGIFNF